MIKVYSTNVIGRDCIPTYKINLDIYNVETKHKLIPMEYIDRVIILN